MPWQSHQHHHPLLKDPARHGCRVHWGLHWRESPTTRTRAWNPSRRTGGKERKEKKLFTGGRDRAEWVAATHCSLPSVGASKQAPHLPRISTARQPGRPEHRGDANPVCAPSASGGNTGPLDLSLHCHCACVRAGYEHGTCSLLHMGRTRQTDRTGRIDSNCRARGRAGSAARACVTRRPSRRQLRGHRHSQDQTRSVHTSEQNKKRIRSAVLVLWMRGGALALALLVLELLPLPPPLGTATDWYTAASSIGGGPPGCSTQGVAGGWPRKAREHHPSFPSIHPSFRRCPSSCVGRRRRRHDGANRSSCMARGIACNCICICRRHDGQNYGASEHRAGTTHHEPTTTATTMHASTMLVRQSVGQRRPSS